MGQLAKLPVRIAAFNKPPIIGIINEGGERNCKFSEAMGNAANDLVHYGHFNCTVVQTPKEEGYGRINPLTGKYDGMHGSVQANNSDFGLAIEMIPLEVDEFKYGPVLTSSRITVTSLYRPSVGSSIEDLSVADSFDAISLNVWFLLAGFMLAFWFLLIIGKQLLKFSNQLSSWWTVFTFIFNEETFEPSGPFFCIFSVLITLLLFYAREYFNNFTKTELVQPRFPRVIDSFEDILNLKYNPDHGYVHKKSSWGKEKKSRDLEIVFSREMRTIDYFRYEHEGSIRKAIYNQAVKFHGSHEKTLRSMDVGNLEEMASLIKNDVVLVEVLPISQLLRVIMCTAIKHQAEADPSSDIARSTVWSAKNASIPYLLAYVYSDHIRPDIRERLDSQFYRIAESGIVHTLMIELSSGFIPITSSIYPCLEDVMRIQVPTLEHLEPKHFASTFEFGSRIYITACALLVVELFKSRFLLKRRLRLILLLPLTHKFRGRKRRVHPRPSAAQMFDQRLTH